MKENTNNTKNTIIIEAPTKAKSKPILGDLNTADVTAIASVLTAFVSVVVAYNTIRKYSKDHKLQCAQLEESKKQIAIEKAKSKIENFYGPMIAHLDESRVIFEHFALEEKSNLSANNTYFRTLHHLTENTSEGKKGIKRLKPHDQELFKHILRISDQVTQLIEENSGYVDNPALHTLLGKLAAHYRIIKSASKNKLQGQADNLKGIIFPLEINGAINSEICKLTKIINDDIDEKIPKTKTINYYNSNSISYYHKTITSAAMSAIYEKVEKEVIRGANILDAGCGVGRDTRYFIQKGYKVTSFDASEKMVEMCNEYPFAFCEQKSFNTIKYPPVFDLVWACASLLHLNKTQFEDALYKLYRAIKPGGLIYFSLKKNITTDNTERSFYTYDETHINTILITQFQMTKVETWDTYSSINSSETFINYLYKK